MKSQLKIDIKNRLLNGATALGNSHIGFDQVCSDLINDALKRGVKLRAIADGTYLSTATVERMAKLDETPTGRPYDPGVDTVKRVLKFFGAEAHFTETVITGKYQNQPKPY